MPFATIVSQITKTIEQLRDGKGPSTSSKGIRPTTWGALQFRPVPWQEGEEGEVEVSEPVVDFYVLVRMHVCLHDFLLCVF